MGKDIRIAVRVTAKEKEKIQSKARKCGMSTTEYVKQRALIPAYTYQRGTNVCKKKSSVLIPTLGLVMNTRYGADVHKGFNKHTGTYNHIAKNAHFSLILFCGTMYLQRRFLHYES